MSKISKLLKEDKKNELFDKIKYNDKLFRLIRSERSGEIEWDSVLSFVQSVYNKEKEYSDMDIEKALVKFIDFVKLS